jgi:hypothetical protein
MSSTPNSVRCPLLCITRNAIPGACHESRTEELRLSQVPSDSYVFALSRPMIWGLRKPVEARGNGTKAPAAWAQIIDDYMLTLAAAGQPPTTTELRRIQLVRMARDIGGRPADVAGEKFVEWFGRQTGWTIETRRSYRAGIRGFFRWAYRTKRVPDHLADELPKVREQRGQRGRRGRGPTAYEAICLTSGISSASTGIICSVRSVCALHTTHCRPNVTFRIGLSGNNLWKQSKQIF